MTRPFQYDNFVQSQIAMGTGNLDGNYTTNVLIFIVSRKVTIICKLPMEIKADCR